MLLKSYIMSSPETSHYASSRNSSSLSKEQFNLLHNILFIFLIYLSHRLLFICTHIWDDNKDDNDDDVDIEENK